MCNEQQTCNNNNNDLSRDLMQAGGAETGIPIGVALCSGRIHCAYAVPEDSIYNTCAKVPLDSIL